MIERDRTGFDLRGRRRPTSRSRGRGLTAVFVGARVLAGAAFLGSGTPTTAPAASDPEAIEIAESLLEAMGGREAWERTRYVRWRFGNRLHHWDRQTGDVRIESEDRLVLMNLWSKEGRVWDGDTLLEGTSRREALETGYAWWVNDSYWLLMPYKLLDPGVNLRYRGESALEDGRPADLLTLTFDAGVGLTPENKYDVWVARESGLVEQWAYYASTEDEDPVFTLPWGGWRRFGDILLATEHGRGADWEIAVPEELPRRTFEKP